MPKKFLAGIFLLMIISSQASAMRLELDPQPIGKISFDGEHFQIEGAIEISKRKAQFDEYFYFHFDAAENLSTFGDRNKKNSVSVDTLGETEIYQIKNTAGWDLFLLKKSSDTDDDIKVLGKRDGKWIEQLNVPALREKYDISRDFRPEKFFTEDNNIIFRYRFQEQVTDVVCHYHAFNEKFYPEEIRR